MLRCDGGRARREEEVGGARGDTRRGGGGSPWRARWCARVSNISDTTKVTSRGFFSEFKFYLRTAVSRREVRRARQSHGHARRVPRAPPFRAVSTFMPRHRPFPRIVAR